MEESVVDQSQAEEPADPTGGVNSAWKFTGWLCTGVIVTSVLACIVMAGSRSRGLTAITVTALDPDAEPRDHNLPLIKRTEALPDYALTVKLTDGGRVKLGTRPDTSAADGLTWKIADPMSVTEIASISLTETDKLISDAVAEVQIDGDSQTDKGYRFDFTSEYSLDVGWKSFFTTPIGKAICAGFCIAVVLIILRVVYL